MRVHDHEDGGGKIARQARHQLAERLDAAGGRPDHDDVVTSPACIVHPTKTVVDA
jgi:hypothetical protein